MRNGELTLQRWSCAQLWEVLLRTRAVYETGRTGKVYHWAARPLSPSDLVPRRLPVPSTSPPRWLWCRVATIEELTTKLRAVIGGSPGGIILEAAIPAAFMQMQGQPLKPLLGHRSVRVSTMMRGMAVVRRGGG